MKASMLIENRDSIKTPFKGVDELLGGGIPCGKIVEIAGSWSVGKSTMAYQIIGAAQNQERNCLLLDAERAYTNDYAKLLGVNSSQLEIAQYRTAEEYLDHVIEWCEEKRNKGGLVVIDAIGALLPQEEAEKTSESRSIGLQARIIGSFCRKIVPILDDNNIALLILNHTFIPLGQMGVASSGGKKLEFARSVWLILTGAYGKPVKRSADGLKTLIPMQIEVRKNKVVPNMGTKITLDLVQGAGFIGETVLPPEPKKRGRPKSPTSSRGADAPMTL
jgi:recombination protein RecA